MLPADELHRVRAEIRALKAREAALVAAMLEDPGGPSCRGRAWEGRVRLRTRRMIDPERLPLSVLAHPGSWMLERRLGVRLIPAGAAPDHTPRALRPLVEFALAAAG